MARNQKDFTFDSDLELKDAGLIAADAAAQVDSAAKVIDLGAARFDGRVIIDATAVEVASGDEIYDVIVELSSSSTFASTIVRGPSFRLGDAAAMEGGADADNGAGRYELPFTNEVNGTTYQYVRLYTEVAGTIATGVNYSAFIVQP